MVEIKEMDLENNEVTFEDFSKVNYDQFENEFREHFNHLIAGETLSPFDIERFMKRTSSKNVSQLVHGKKAEGFLEATTGKKMDPGIVKFILIMILITVIAVIAVFALKSFGLF